MINDLVDNEEKIETKNNEFTITSDDIGHLIATRNKQDEDEIITDNIRQKAIEEVRKLFQNNDTRS